MSEIEELINANLKELRERISAAALLAGGNGSDIAFVAVSKFRSVEEIRVVIGAGVTQIGENRVQEAAKKRPDLPKGFVYRMIGHLQSNKAGDAARIFDTVDSVDSVRVGAKISEEAVKAGKVIPVLLEVNSSGEGAKFGFEPAAVEAAADALSGLPGIGLCGLMTIGPLTGDEGAVRLAFEMTRKLFETVRGGREGFETLSMGMTDDFEAAIEEGSNMVRIGRAVFERR
jgi:PLP dependent protein